MNWELGGDFVPPQLTRVQRKISMTDKVLRQTIVDELDFEPSVDSANIGVASMTAS